MARRNGSANRKNQPAHKRGGDETTLRIIGGRLRGRLLRYSGDRRTRPMKDRVREAVFNLVGPAIKDKLAIDLFAGTGAIGLEALSRGAAQAILLEQHFPSADLIRQNVAALEVESVTQVIAVNTFTWLRRQAAEDLSTEMPWVVFCSPPFDFYLDRTDDMQELTRFFCRQAPAGSLFLAEADQRFDFGLFADFGNWDVRDYPPARVGLLECDPQNRP